MKDRDVIIHKKWLGLAQPIEGLVFGRRAVLTACVVRSGDVTPHRARVKERA
jgi:hypothetical protein